MSHLRDGGLINGVGSDLLVNIEQSKEVAGPAIKQLIWDVRIGTQYRALQLKEPDKCVLAQQLLLVEVKNESKSVHYMLCAPPDTHLERQSWLSAVFFSLWWTTAPTASGPASPHRNVTLRPLRILIVLFT